MSGNVITSVDEPTVGVGFGVSDVMEACSRASASSLLADIFRDSDREIGSDARICDTAPTIPHSQKGGARTGLHGWLTLLANRAG